MLATKVYAGDSKKNVSKNSLVSIEPWTSYIPLWKSPDWDNLAFACKSETLNPYNLAAYILAKWSESKCQLVQQHKWS